MRAEAFQGKNQRTFNLGGGDELRGEDRSHLWLVWAKV